MDLGNAIICIKQKSEKVLTLKVNCSDAFVWNVPLLDELWNSAYDSSIWLTEWSRTHSRQLAHISPNRSAPRTHFNTHYWNRFSMIHHIAVWFTTSQLSQQEFITPLEWKSSFKNKASICKSMPSLDGHLVNWVILFKEGISIWANQGRSSRHITPSLTVWGQMQVRAGCTSEQCATAPHDRWEKATFVSQMRLQVMWWMNEWMKEASIQLGDKHILSHPAFLAFLLLYHTGDFLSLHHIIGGHKKNIRRMTFSSNDKCVSSNVKL